MLREQSHRPDQVFEIIRTGESTSIQLGWVTVYANDLKWTRGRMDESKPDPPQDANSPRRIQVELRPVPQIPDLNSENFQMVSKSMFLTRCRPQAIDHRLTRT